MKTFFSSLIFGFFAAFLTAVYTTLTFAQASCSNYDANKALYDKFIDNYQSNKIAKVRLAIAAAKEYVQKYGSCNQYKDQVDYLKAAPSSLEKRIEKLEEKLEKAKRDDEFDASIKTANWDSTYQIGKDILADEPDQLDVILVLGSIGLDQAMKKPAVDRYNNDTIKYAKLAIQKINSGKTSKKFGAYQYTYKSKENALGWMNYTIGQIMFLRQSKNDASKKKEGLKYLYKASMFDSDVKKNPLLYGSLGDYYLSKAVKLGKEREALDPKVEENFEKIDNLFGLEKAYAERGVDAYARSYILAKTDKTATPAYKKLLYDRRLKPLYTFRFQKPLQEDGTPEENIDARINSYVTYITRTPLPNPTDEIIPILEKKMENSE